MEKTNKPLILIADDSEMNRSILWDMLGDEYEILEAENGVEAVAALKKYETDIALVLLDIVMPEMDGFEVLAMMNKYHWIKDIPVIIISAESSSTYLERAYELGVTDYINRPFDDLIVHRRVINTILLYAKQKRLIGLVADQILEKEKRSSLMIDILSHIVEFRNGESGLHVLHIHTITELLLKRLAQKTDRYPLSREEINVITMASALHDIGKIAIPSEILNKPGRFTPEEFEIMKTHAALGASMLEQIPIHQEESLVRVAYEICRWHHERFDGRGYPDGLHGDAIPISAQIVSIADVYDALTSERVYKKAYSHETALTMILDGECGAFNPLLLKCLLDVADTIKEELSLNSIRNNINQKEVRGIADEMLHHKELTASERTLRLLDHERMKYRFFASMSKEIQFEYSVEPPMVTISDWGVEQLGLKEVTMNPRGDRKIVAMMGQEVLDELAQKLRAVPANQNVEMDFKICLNGEARWHHIVCRATWAPGETKEYVGAIGKVTDVHNERAKLSNLEKMATHDALTGLLNHASAKKIIEERIHNQPDGNYALMILDLDHFKVANDEHGHIFGDHVLKYFAGRLTQSVRSGDVTARVGGDEFLIFLEYRQGFEHGVDRIYHSLLGEYEGFKISVSMGIARIDENITDYDGMFHRADQALYAVKRSGRGQYRFYDDSLTDTISMVSPIDGRTEDAWPAGKNKETERMGK